MICPAGARQPRLQLVYKFQEDRLSCTTCFLGMAPKRWLATPVTQMELSLHRTVTSCRSTSRPALPPHSRLKWRCPGKRGPLETVQVQAGKAGNLWRSRNMGREASEVVQGLKRAKGDPALAQTVIDEKLARLVRQDALLVLGQLQGQNKWDLALLVFRHIETEPWFKADDEILLPMLSCLVDGGHPEMARELLLRCQAQHSWDPSLDALQVLLKGYCQAGDAEAAVPLLREMVAQGGEARVLGAAFNSAIRLCQEQGLSDLACQLAEERKAGLKDEATAAQEGK